MQADKQLNKKINILLFRQNKFNVELSQKITNLGAEYNPIKVPLICIKYIYIDLNFFIDKIGKYDLIIFTSRNSVIGLQKIMNVNNLQDFKSYPGIFNDKKMAAIGYSTKNELLNFGFNKIITPDRDYNSLGLFKKLKKTNNIEKKNILIIKGEQGLNSLVTYIDNLKKQKKTQNNNNHNYKLDSINLYRRLQNKENELKLFKIFDKNIVDFMWVTSEFVLKQIEILCKDPIWDIIIYTKLIVPSLRLQQIAQKSGFKNIFLIENAVDKSLIKFLKCIQQGEIYVG